jgi:ribosomal protein S12 methylthiotransferase accessory factor
LISSISGIVKKIDTVQVEEDYPIIVKRAIRSNSELLSDPTINLTSGGKGITDSEAQRSAIGEAVEYYSSVCWDPGVIQYASRRELNDLSLDPRKLVLYAETQYAKIPFAPYSDYLTIGWVPARSLLTNQLGRV